MVKIFVQQQKIHSKSNVYWIWGVSGSNHLSCSVWLYQWFLNTQACTHLEVYAVTPCNAMNAVWLETVCYNIVFLLYLWSCMVLQKCNEWIMENKHFKYFPTVILQQVILVNMSLNWVALECLTLKIAVWSAVWDSWKDSVNFGLRLGQDFYPFLKCLSKCTSAFCTMYLCKVSFSTLMIIKPKSWSLLKAEEGAPHLSAQIFIQE